MKKGKGSWKEEVVPKRRVPKKQKWSGKENRGPKGRRWRPWLEERSWKWGKILEMKEVGGDECQRMPRDLDWWHPRLVTGSSCTIPTDVIFCPILPGQQWPHCWEAKSRPSEHNTGGGGKQVRKIIKQVKNLWSHWPLNKPQYADPHEAAVYPVSPATTWWDSSSTVLQERGEGKKKKDSGDKETQVNWRGQGNLIQAEKGWMLNSSRNIKKEKQYQRLILLPRSFPSFSEAKCTISFGIRRTSLSILLEN